MFIKFKLWHGTNDVISTDILEYLLFKQTDVVIATSLFKIMFHSSILHF